MEAVIQATIIRPGSLAARAMDAHVRERLELAAQEAGRIAEEVREREVKRTQWEDRFRQDMEKIGLPLGETRITSVPGFLGNQGGPSATLAVRSDGLFFCMDYGYHLRLGVPCSCCDRLILLSTSIQRLAQVGELLAEVMRPVHFCPECNPPAADWTDGKPIQDEDPFA